MTASGPVEVVLVAGGRWHDIGFARHTLLALLDEHDLAHVRVAADFAEVAGADVLVSYTSDVRPTPRQTAALVAWVERGGRWLALHATCSAVDPHQDGTFSTPRVIDGLARLLGAQFLAHPPIGAYRVELTDPNDPLLAGLTGFDTVDELYVVQVHEPLEVLMHTDFAGGACRGFAEGGAVPPGPQPVLWRKRTGLGTVTYLTLGHCRGRWDVADLGRPDTGARDRTAWEAPGFRAVVRRGIAWAVHGDDFAACRVDPVPATAGVR